MDDRISRALRSLPRAEARPGFTDAVRRRLEERRVHRRRPLARWPVRLAVAAACLLAVALGAREWWHHHRRQQTVARLTALEAEHRALVAELAGLRRQLDAAQPVVYLGGSDEIDLVLDLAELQRAGFRPEGLHRDRLRTSAARPFAAGPAGPAPAGLETAQPHPSRRPTTY